MAGVGNNRELIIHTVHRAADRQTAAWRSRQSMNP